MCCKLNLKVDDFHHYKVTIWLKLKMYVFLCDSINLDESGKAVHICDNQDLWQIKKA